MVSGDLSGEACGMSVWAYLRGHVLAVAIALLTVGLLWPMLRLVGLGGELVTLIVLCVALALLAMGIANYLHTRAWCRRFAEVARAGGDAPELALSMEEPDAPEAQVVFEALQAVATEANARVSDSRLREREHREFVETWVHEVKTPLAAIDLMLENLDDARLAPLARELDRVGSLVEQALYFARSSSVESDYLVRTCTLEALVRGAVKSRAHALVGAHVAVGMEGLDRTVFADHKWMQFVLGQLIDNAVRYRRDPVDPAACDAETPGGAAADGPRIDFSARVLDEGRADERVVLSVRDNGCGISAADIGRVFDKGFTGSNGRVYAKSTGIGLYLVRSLCEKMGLSVSASSVEGEWTCFEIVFPTNRMKVLGDDAAASLGGGRTL